jgi:hypothetical protein
VDQLGTPAVRSDPTSFSDDGGSSDMVNQWRGAIGDAVDATSCGGCHGGLFTLCRDGACVIPTCSVVREMGLCLDPSEPGVRARIFCPRACGCTAPVTSLVLNQPENGCPALCVRKPEYQAQLYALTERCEDVSHVNGPFAEFIRGIGTTANRTTGTVHVCARSEAPGFHAWSPRNDPANVAQHHHHARRHRLTHHQGAWLQSTGRDSSKNRVLLQ